MNMKIHALTTQINAVTEKEPGIFAVAVIDPLSGQTFCNDKRPMRSASLIKLFIMAEAFAGISDGSLHPEETITFREFDRVGGAGILQTLPAETSHTVLGLIELMITESDNIATNLLIDRLGMQAINERILNLGCTATVLRRKMMDFEAASSGAENLTSALDIACTLAGIHLGQCVEPTADAAMCQLLGRQTDRCKIPDLLPHGTLCQHKTGELPGAEHDAGIIYAPSGPYILAIMSDGQSNPAKAIYLVAKISKIVYDWFEQHR